MAKKLKSFWCEDDIWWRFKQIAAGKQKSMTDLLNEVIQEYIEKN